MLGRPLWLMPWPRNRPSAPLFAVLLFAVLLVLVLALFCLLAFDGVLVGDHDLAVADLSTPPLGLLLGESDVPLEVLEVQPCTAALGAPEVARLLEEPGRVVLHDEHDPGQVRSQLMEADGATRGALGTLRRPDDPVVGHLLLHPLQLHAVDNANLDMDPAAVAATRRRVLGDAARAGTVLVGPLFAAPGAGRVEADGEVWRLALLR